MFPRPPFFPKATLNFAENLLYPSCDPDENTIAIIAATEITRESVTWAQLRHRVRQCAAILESLGVNEGDRVAGYLANHASTVIAMLATTSLGAIWTGVSPDTGVYAVLDRLTQVQPKILFCDNAVMYNGKWHEVHNKVKGIASELPSLAHVLVFNTVAGHAFDLEAIKVNQGNALMFDDTVKAFAPNALPTGFRQFPADHPIYILFSSGTTGKPKCIIHGAIGTLIQHKKEHDIHCDIRPGDRFFYYTTCTWMMWHWLVSGLATGATLVLYDGSPFRPLDSKGSSDMAMPNLIEELKITHFGTSAKYLSLLEQKALFPKERGTAMSSLRAIYSTGSPLPPSTFQYIYRSFGTDINLGSITGGTDIISLFGAPSQISPVFVGEIQVRGLGMAVKVWDAEGKDITDDGKPGDLVCVKAFPCQPVAFWGPDGEALYRKAYFETFPGIWHHGDFVRLNPHTGGMTMLGRSDGVLKPAGVRFGSAEIYNILFKHFPEGIEDALCVGRRKETDIDEVVVLFVKMARHLSFSEDLGRRIQGIVRSELSARHVPAVVDECPEIPVTTNGKK